FCDFSVRWISKHKIAPANDDGYVADRNLKTIQQALDPCITIEINIVIRMRITCEKFLDAKCICGVNGANQNHIAEVLRNEFDMPQNKRTKENITQLAVGLYHRQQLFAVQFDHFSRFARADLDYTGATEQNTDFACELTRPKHRNDFFGTGLHNFQFTTFH